MKRVDAGKSGMTQESWKRRLKLEIEKDFRNRERKEEEKMKQLSSILALGAIALTGSAFGGLGDTIWGIDNGADMLGTFDSETPEVFNPIGNTGIAGFANSLEFGDNGELFAGDADTLYSVDRGTGAATPIGNGFGISNGETMGDFAYDAQNGIMYGIATSCNVQSSIYTIDLTSGVASMVCTTDLDVPCDVGLTFDADGNLYGLDIVSNQIYAIDLNDCSTATHVILPYNANFGQGLTAGDDNAWHVAFNNDEFRGELYSFDADGNYDFFGVLEPQQIAAADVESGPVSACLSLEIGPMVGGEKTAFEVGGGEPGHRGVVVWGLGGDTSIFEDVNGWCATFGFDVKLKGRKVRIVGSSVFDANGELTINRRIPDNHPGLDVLFQAAERETCPGECMSDIVVGTIN